MTIHEARTPAQVRACYPVMRQLRSHLDEERFVEQVARQRDEGYRLVYVEEDGQPVAVAGFRVLEMLSRGRFIYVDDLVTVEARRSEGLGSRLVEWLVDHARELGCERVDLDSGLERKRAHAFYDGSGFERVATHFRRELD